jgi:hypothetical protein
VKIFLNAQAELELVEGAAYYARNANPEIAGAFIGELLQRDRACTARRRSGRLPCAFGRQVTMFIFNSAGMRLSELRQWIVLGALLAVGSPNRAIAERRGAR